MRSAFTIQMVWGQSCVSTAASKITPTKPCFTATLATPNFKKKTKRRIHQKTIVMAGKNWLYKNTIGCSLHTLYSSSPPTLDPILNFSHCQISSTLLSKSNNSRSLTWFWQKISTAYQHNMKIRISWRATSRITSDTNFQKSTTLWFLRIRLKSMIL